MIFNYVIIEEGCPDDKGNYIPYIFRGFINKDNRQLIELKRQSFIIDIRDMKIRSFHNYLPYCFIIGGRVYEYYGNYLIYYLRSHYKKCRIIIQLTDLVQNYYFEYERLREYFDNVIVFEKGDSIKYKFDYLTETFEYLDVKPESTVSDFFFVGAYNKQKGRLGQIVKLYDLLIKKGYKCDFWIPDIPEEVHTTRPNINKDYLPFGKALSHIASTKCIVEIAQADMLSPTIRFIEAVLYGKHILTNAKGLMLDEVYSRYENIVQYIDDNMKLDFINSKCEYDIKEARHIFSNDTYIYNIEQLIMRGDKR